jgi:very-short-patch-repair endonuclease
MRGLRRATPVRSRTRVARRLRRAAIDAEIRLWRGVREMLNEHRSRRQHPIGQYIVDFACPARKLAIELDGGQYAEQQEQDAARTENLARRGYRVIRFWNRDVTDNLLGVLDLIRQELNAGRK